MVASPQLQYMVAWHTAAAAGIQVISLPRALFSNNDAAFWVAFVQCGCTCKAGPQVKVL
jgi:hypothetical protein